VSTRPVLFIGLLTLLVASAPRNSRAAGDTPPFQLHDGDRVVFLGDALFERDGKYGCIETALSLAFPDSKLTFRNLGWSGDNVFARSRDYFDQQGDGYARRIAHVNRLKPTVMLLAYGGNESYGGEAGLAQFAAGYRRLLDDLEKTGARFVLLSPIRQENLGPPLPDPAPQNRNRELYAAEIKKLAAERGHRFVDLFNRFASSGGPLTYNGIHLDQRGYEELAKTICRELGLPIPAFDGRDELRRSIVEKNRLYFYRWRPSNETYLFGHRKHEQGKNAVEIPQFDPLVAEKEKQIAALLVDRK
jgi:lysophospholipase L1-like esterase